MQPVSYHLNPVCLSKTNAGPLMTMQALQTSDAALLTLATCCGDGSTPCLLPLEETSEPLLTHPSPASGGRLSSRQSKPTGAAGDLPRQQGRVAHWAGRQGVYPCKCVAKWGRGGGGRGGGDSGTGLCKQDARYSSHVHARAADLQRRPSGPRGCRSPRRRSPSLQVIPCRINRTPALGPGPPETRAAP